MEPTKRISLFVPVSLAQLHLLVGVHGFSDYRTSNAISVQEVLCRRKLVHYTLYILVLLSAHQIFMGGKARENLQPAWRVSEDSLSCSDAEALRCGSAKPKS